MLPGVGIAKSWSPFGKKLAESFDEIPNVSIAKMDGTLNEVSSVQVQGFPTLYFYPATEDGSKKGPGIKYEGAREFEDLQAFVELHGTNVPSDSFRTPVETHEEL